MLAEGKNPDGSISGFEKDESGNLKIAGTFSAAPPVGGATEDKQDSQISQIGEVQASPTANTVLDRLKTIAGKIPGLGGTTAANSLPVVLSSDGPFATNFGAAADAAATTDTGTFSHIALIKRLLSKVPGTTRATTTAAITISSSTTISASVDLLSTSLLAFIAPAAWTASTLKIQGSADNTNWSDIFGSDGVAVSSWSAITAAAAYSVDVADMLPYRYIRFVAGTAQAADRTFTVITRPLA